MLYFVFPTVSNNTADAGTCEVKVTLALLHTGSQIYVW